MSCEAELAPFVPSCAKQFDPDAQSVKIHYDSSNDLEVVDQHDLLNKLIETSASKDKPIIVNDSQNQTVGVVSQSDLLKAVIEGGDGE